MADTRNIKIEIISTANGSGGTAPSTPSPTPVTPSPQPDNQRRDLLGELAKFISEKLAPAVTLTALAHQGIQTVKSAGEFAYTSYLSLTDDYIAERDTQTAIGVNSRALSTIATITGSAVIAGPVGAVVATAVQGITIGVDIAKNYHTQSVSIRQNEYNQQYQRVRSGYSLTAGSIGENK